MEDNQPAVELNLKQKINTFVDEIKDIDPTTSDRLKLIADSLEEGGFWINLDLYSVINPRLFLERAESALRYKDRRQKFIPWLERIQKHSGSFANFSNLVWLSHVPLLLILRLFQMIQI